MIVAKCIHNFHITVKRYKTYVSVLITSEVGLCVVYRLLSRSLHQAEDSGQNNRGIIYRLLLPEFSSLICETSLRKRLLFRNERFTAEKISRVICLLIFAVDP